MFIRQILFLAIIFSFLVPSFSAVAQTPPPPPLSGAQIIQQLGSGALTPAAAATNFAQQAGITVPEAQTILGNIGGLPAAAQTAAGNLVDSVISGAVPPNIAQTLSTLNTLGQLATAGSIAAVFQDPALVAQLSALAPAELQQMIGTITALTALPSALQALGTAAIMNAIQSLLPPSLAALIGGLLDPSSFLNGLFSGGGSVTAGFTGPSGSYEIFPAVRNRGPANTCTNNVCGIIPRCTSCEPTIETNHGNIRAHTTNSFIVHRTWMIDEFFSTHLLPAMALMTSQLNTIMMQQAFIIGTFFDAKHQLETQRLFQQLMAEAHKDYQPSEGMCDIGTNVRSLAGSSQKTKLAHAAFSSRLMARQLRNQDTASGSGDDTEIRSRIAMFVQNHCNVADNSNGLNFLCTGGGTNVARRNKDVDFINTIDANLTLDLDFSGAQAANSTPDKEDIFAFSANIFGHNPLPGIAGNLMTDDSGFPSQMAYRYLDIRSLAAKRGVGQNAFSAIVAERASGDPEVAPYLKSIVTELGVPVSQINALLGENPSYFAQMEVLTKSLYQNPVFYTELYDKPANVLRKQASIAAISSMQERDMYETQLQIEGVFASIGEEMLAPEFRRLENQFKSFSGEKEDK